MNFSHYPSKHESSNPDTCPRFPFTANLWRVRTLLVSLYLVLIFPQSCLADEDLKSLYDAHQWFELRDSVRRGGASLFYEGAVACAFNHLRQCEKMLNAFVSAHAGSDQAYDAHRILASTYVQRRLVSSSTLRNNSYAREQARTVSINFRWCSHFASGHF
jgi:hypothetical protein